jgi:chitodextrinase
MNLRVIAALLLACCCSIKTAWGFNFSISTLQGVSLINATSLQFGADQRLYVLQVDGTIKALTVQRNAANSYQVTATETITLVRSIPNYNDDGTRNTTLAKRQATGLLVTGTVSSPVLYVSSSDPRIGGGAGGENDLNLDTNSGIVSRLTKSGTTWTKVDLVRGLPRSEENHASNGMQLEPITNTLYLAQGGNTNAGSPSINFAYASETALSAAILAIDLNALNAMPVKTDANGQKYVYDLPTLNDPNPSRAHNSDGTNVNDPFGGNDGLNQAKLVPGGPVQIYAPGFRNAYDLVITRAPGREGRIYAFDNGANQGWGGLPKNEGGGTATNEYVQGETGAVNNLDGLHFITGQGYYGGHPNPTRANPSGAGWFRYDNTQPAGSQEIYSMKPTTDWPSVPVSMADPVEGDFRLPGSTASGTLMTVTTSTNGIAEYVATNFSGAMKGNLIAASYDGRLLRVALSADGKTVTNGVEVLASGFGSQPLDVTAPDPEMGANFVGTIWVAHYSPSKISILEPADFDSASTASCTGINSFGVDEDNDGYSNADEIANDSDPCSGAIRPPDADGDHTSDLLDQDDDNDGIDDTQDAFPLDAQNGANTTIPAHYEFFNSTGYGFYGIGLTGLMMNRGEDYLQRITTDNVIAGGTAGLFTVAQVGPGLALGTSNSQKDAYHTAVNASALTTPFVVSSRLGGPFFGNAPKASQRQGIYIGTGDQDNFVWVALHANNGAGGMEVVYELGGTIVSQKLYPFSGLSGNSTIDLSFEIDPSAGTVQPGYRLPGATTTVTLGTPIHVTGAVLQSVSGAQPLAAGVFATTSSSATPTFSATWDYIDVAAVAVPASMAIAKVTIDPNSTNMATSSTYINGAFKIQNLSTGGQQIDRVTIDLSTAMFRDMVYDPTGTAGDDVAKGFQPDSMGAGVSVASGVFAKPHNGTNSQDGYDEVDVTFNSFPANASMSFSVDVDPTSVKGVAQPGQGDAASISGLELIGSTVTAYFSDGAVHRTRLGRVEGSVDGSYGWLRSDVPAKPGISFVGQTSPLKTGQAAQTVRVSGAAGLTASLVSVEAALYVGGVPNGGYDLDPFESNTAIKVNEVTATIPSAGYMDFPVTATKTNVDAGYNIYTATLSDAAKIKGPASDALTLWYDPSFSGGGGDTQAPTSPGTLTFTTVTANSVKLNWTAATDNVGVTGYRVSRDGTLIGTVTALNYADSGLAPSTSYSYSVVAMDAAGNASPARTGSVATIAGTGGGTATMVRVNSGGPAYTDGAGNTWSADTGYNSSAVATSTATVTGTTDPTLYKTERYTSSTTTPLTYTLGVPNGTYRVRLYFAETYPATQAVGARVFDVDVQSVRAFEDVDIFAQAGANKALMLEKVATVTNGQVKISFIRQVQNPKINAIEIVPDTAPADTQPPTAPGTLAFTGVSATSVTVNWSAATDNVGVTGYQISRGAVVLATINGLSYTDTGLAASTSYTYSVVAVDAAGNGSTARTGTIATTAGTGGTSTSVRINAGGPGYTNGSGVTWSADNGYSGGAVATSTTTVTGTTDPTLYKTERYTSSTTTPLTYTAAVPNGNYIVRLYFAETYAKTQATGARVFDVDIQSVRAFEDVDIFAQAGGANKALMLEKPTTVTNGQVKISFIHQVENPKVNAIEIVPATSTTDTQAPSSPGSLTFSGVTSSSVTVNWSAATDNVGVTGYRISRGSTVLSTVTGLSYTDAALSPSTSYTYSVVALDAAGNASVARTGAIATTASGGGTPSTSVRINAGGPSYTSGSGTVWSADTGYNSGTIATTTTNTVTGTTDPTLFKTERYTTSTTAPLTYTVAVPNGNYVVRLYFAETYTATQATGARVFDIDIQSLRAFEDVDIFAQAGGANKALMLEKAATVTNGQIKISLLHQVENPKINAIEIVPATTAAVRVNAGGQSYVDTTGNTWSADSGYSGGSVYTSTATVSGTSDPKLYQTERFQSSTTAPLTYTFSVPNGDYQVRLFFAETYARTQAAGARVFDVDIQAVRAFEDVDIFAQAGANKALVLQKAATVTNGQLKISLLRQVENPKINAIEVVPVP